MSTPTLSFPFLCIIGLFVAQLAHATKLDELHRIKARLEADLKTSYTTTSAPLYWGQKELATLHLTRVATWLSTLSDRALTLTEQQAINEIFSQLLQLEQDHLPFPKTELKRIEIFGQAKQLENELSRLLTTDSRPTQSFLTLDESGIWQSILHFLPEEQRIEKAQVDRRWRKEVHTYQKKKGYPPVLTSEDRRRFKQKLRNQNVGLSESEIDTIIQDSEFHGLNRYESFVRTLFRFLQARALSIHTPTSQRLQALSRHLPEDSLLSQLIEGLIMDRSRPDGLTVRNSQAQLAVQRDPVLPKYIELARDGNFYAIQTLLWLKALSETSPVIIHGVPLNLNQINSVLPKDHAEQDFLVSVRDFAQWREISKVQVSNVPDMDYFGAPYSYRAAVSRSYRASQSLMKHLDYDKILPPFSLELIPAQFLNRKELLVFYYRAKQHCKEERSFTFCLDEEARSYAALGNPQTAMSLLENEDDINTPATRDALILYEALLLWKSGQGKPSLLKGRNESGQNRIMEDLEKIRSEKLSIPQKLLDAGLFREAFEYDKHLSETVDYYHPLSKQALLKGFYKGGVLTSIERKIKGSDDLSQLDSILDPEIYWPKALELALTSSKSQTTQEYFSDDEICFLKLLEEARTDPNIWNDVQALDQSDICLLSDLKEFKRIVNAHNTIYFSYVDDPWVQTRLAQARLEQGNPKKCLETLNQKYYFNIVDYELKIRALQAIGKDESSTLRAKEEFERDRYLPDLRQAAKLYEGDKDFLRAKKALSRVCQLSERLADPGLKEDRMNYQRVLNAVSSSEESDSR